MLKNKYFYVIDFEFFQKARALLYSAHFIVKRLFWRNLNLDMFITNAILLGIQNVPKCFVVDIMYCVQSVSMCDLSQYRYNN